MKLSEEGPPGAEFSTGDARHDTPDIPEPAGAEISALAANLCGVPLCVIALFDGARSWVTADREFSAAGALQEPSICWHASQSDAVLEVNDAAADARFAADAWVAGPQKIRFFAGVPIRSGEGPTLGALCIMAREPRVLESIQRQALTVLAAQLAGQLQARRAMEELRAENLRLRETARISRVGTWRSMLGSDELEWSPIVYEIFGVSPEEFGGRLEDFLASVHPSDLAEIRKAAEAAVQGAPLDIEHRITRPDGTVRWVHEQGELIRDAAGTPLYVAGTVQDVSERRSLSRHWKILFDVSDDLICIASTDGYFIQVNPSFERTLGWTAQEMLSKPFAEFIVPQDRERTAEEMSRLASGLITERFENRFRTRDGEVRVLEWSSVPIPDEKLIYAIARDVTRERQLQQRVAQLAERNERILETIPDGFAVVDREWRFTYVNHAAEEFLGRSRAAATLLSVTEIFPEFIGSEFHRQYERAIATQSPVTFQAFFEPLERWLDVRACPSPDGLSIYFRDITQRRKADEQLRLLELCVTRLNDIVLITEAEPIDEPGPRTVFVNDAFVRRTGYEREEILGKSPRILQGPKTDRAELDRIRAALQRWEPVRSELVNYSKSGEEFWIEMDIVPVADETGWYTHWVAIERDITGRKQAEEELRAIARRYQLLFESNPLPLWVYDSATLRFLAVNDAAVQKYGYTAEEFCNLTILDIRPAEDAQSLRAELPRRRGGPIFAGLWRHVTKDGRLLTAEIHSQAIEFAGRPARLVLAIDTSEKAALEEQLRQAHRMESVGKLAGGVAHEFNNILTVINGYTQVLLNRARGKDDQSARILEQVLKSGTRAAELTAQLLAFSRKQVLQPQTLSFHSMLKPMVPLLDRLAGADAEIVWRLTPGIGMVTIDPSQFSQVLLNLVVHARDASPKGGTISIESKRAEISGLPAALHPNLPPGSYALITVTDSGEGMPAESARHIFDPFYSAKERRSGSGLGLAMAYGIVTQSGGHITADSAPGSGTRFRVYLPVVPGEETVATEEDDDSDGTSVRARILVVDDDPAIREFAARILRDMGHEVWEASDGSEAIVEAEKHTGEIDLLLTDVVMPNLGGREVAAFLSEQRPGLPVVFMSGYTDDTVVRQGIQDQELNFLAKPFSPSQLAKAVGVALKLHKARQTVMVVDDEQSVREVIADALSGAGYETILCESGHAALARLRESRVDLMVIDLVMPDLEGIETIAMVRKFRPELKVLAISGFGGQDYLKMARALGANRTLAKPIVPEELCDTVKSMLAPPQPPGR